ncbi:MAG: DNA recombination/repair protein RecA, partial [Chitinophagaceae bacterium]|nr:DNA recombination/repair protein RecA [Chitinophagaceae bacterium]
MAKEKSTEITGTNSEKLKALKLTMDKIEKDFGKGSVMLMNERSDVEQG